ncbi:MAG: hypothetical protein ACK5IB_11540 [Qingshengfaniella sp.]
MTIQKAALGALSLAAILAVQAAHAEDDHAVWRIFVADQAAATVTALDLDAPDHRWTFELTGPTNLAVSPEGEAIIAVQVNNDRVDFLTSGIALDDHGDHADLHVEDPAKIDAVLEGPRPFHVVSHDHTIAINFDRGGYVAMIDEHDLMDGDPGSERFVQARAHHGYAVPAGDYILSSVASDAPVEEGKLPPRIGIGAFNADGTPAGDMATCTNLHGEAFSGSYLLSGCSEGVIAADLSGATPAFTMLPYPADFPEGTTGTLLGSTAMQVFLGNFGRDSVVVIDPTAAPYFTRVELPFRRVHFVLDAAKPQFAYILTEDGTLHQLNMLTATIEQSATVTQAYSMDGNSGDPRPRLAMAGDRLAMTDPLSSLVRVIDTADLSELATIPVDGLPYNIVAVGGSGAAH